MQSKQWKQLSRIFLVALVVSMMVMPVQAAAGDTILISRSINPSRVQSKGGSIQTSISEDGRYVAFSSSSRNLVSYDDNQVPDIFVYDRQLDQMERISIASSGEEANGYSENPSISADGRYVAFESYASNLVNGDTNGKKDIFVYDRQTGSTERVSVHSNGGQANADSFHPSISADGKFVTFHSSAFNLVNGDLQWFEEVFLHDRATGVTERISIDSNGTEANSDSINPSISGDGRYIAFESDASNLVADDTNGSSDIFIRDRQMGLTKRISVDANGAEANSGSWRPSISANGRYISFDSEASNLVSDDTSGLLDVFVYDQEIGVVERISMTAEVDAVSRNSSIAANGHSVAYMSNSSTLSNGDTNGRMDIFIYDLQTKQTEYVSVNSSGIGGDYDSFLPDIAGDGRYVAFESLANNLVSGDTNEVSDIYLRDRQANVTGRISLGMLNVAASAASTSSISADGRYVVFTSISGNIISNDTNNISDVFVYDHSTEQVERLLANSRSLEAQRPSLSGDGRYVAFGSQAAHLVSGDTNNTWDAFVYDRETGTVERVSVTSDGTQGNKFSGQATLSADGRYVAFQSAATNLVVGDTSVYVDVFVHDRETGITERVSVTNLEEQVTGESADPVLSADGRYVAFSSYAIDMVSGDTNHTDDIFVRDRHAGLTERVSIASDGTEANDTSLNPAISADGRYVAFRSLATNLVSGDTNGDWDIFVYDRVTYQIERVSVASDGSQANDFSYGPSISHDGRYVAFASYAGNLVDGDTNSNADIFIHDRDTGITELVSFAGNGNDANGSSTYPAISGDGRYVSFGSIASNLVAGDGNETYDLFLHENQVDAPASPLIVTKTTDTNDGVCNSDCSLREAMSVAVTRDTILFHASLTGQTITLSAPLPVVDKILTIDGGAISIKIDGAGSYRVFEVSQTGDLTIDHLTIQNGRFTGSCVDDSTIRCGSGVYSDGMLTIRNSTFAGNSAEAGGAVFIGRGMSTISNSTFISNAATRVGGAIGNWLGTLTVTNSTFYGNSANHGGAIYNDISGLKLINSTLSGNSATHGAGVYNAGISLYFANNILANSLAGEDCYNEEGAGKISANINNLVENNAASPNNCGAPAFANDPKLGLLADHGGPTLTMALEPGSPAIDTGDDASCPDTDQRSFARPQGSHCDLGAYEANSFMEISIGGQPRGSFTLDPNRSNRVSFPGVNNGPVRLMSKDGTPTLAAARVIYKVNNINTSFSEMMGLPSSQLDMVYWLPWYNNKDLDTQLRFANVSNSTATVHVFIGGVEMPGSPFTLQAGESTRKSFAGINNGPVQIASDQNIVAAERVVYKAEDGVNTSFSEVMALPNKQLDTIYWLPWYNNKDIDTQLRFANVTSSIATVHVYIGGVEMPGSPFTLQAGEGTRKSFAGINNGPVRIVSNQKIVAAERLIYKAAGGMNTSFSEMMALPNNLLDMTSWFPWYNNVNLDTQLRFANVSNATATVHVYIGGTEMTGSPFILQAGESTRKSFAGINTGPVQITSDQNIVAAERILYTVNGINTSLSEMMGLPGALLDPIYWLPWYNNVELDTQLRFGLP